MASMWDVGLDDFAAAGINSTVKGMGPLFTISVQPRNIILKPKKCCACAAFDWPLEKVKEVKVMLTEYAQPSMYLSVSSDKGLVAYKFFFLSDEKEAAASECFTLIDQYIEAMGSFMSASPAWLPFIGKAMSPKTVAVAPAPAPAPPPNGEPPAEGEPAAEGEGEVATAAPSVDGKLSYKVSVDHYATVSDPDGLDKYGSDFTLTVYPRELVFKANKFCGGKINYKIEQIKVVQVLTSEWSEPSLLIVCGREEQEVSHKLWVSGGIEAIEECKQGVLNRIEAMCAELGGAPAWWRLAPVQAAPTKKSIFKR